MTNVIKYQMGLKLISISMLHLPSNIKSSRQLLKETTIILVLTDSIESNIEGGDNLIFPAEMLGGSIPRGRKCPTNNMRSMRGRNWTVRL